jgi:hypothetical protein
MTSENEPKPDEQAGQQPLTGDAASVGAAKPAEPTLSDIVEAMRSQQEATARGFAELTSGLNQFVEKLTAAAAATTSQPQAPAGRAEPSRESPAADESATDSPAPQPPTQQPADAPSPEVPVAAPVGQGDQAVGQPAAPQTAPPANPAQGTAAVPQVQAPQAQAVAPPPVDPVAYAQTIPGSGFPQASPQAVAPAGFPAAGQPQAQTPTGYPAVQDPQAPAPQPVQAAPAPQPAQAAPSMPSIREPIRAARDFIRGKRSGPAQVGPPQPRAQQPGQDDRWQRILFGPDIANNQALSTLRDKVLEGLLNGERQATGFVGTILLFQAASSERMPQILKDIGEAYYRWNPRTQLGDDPLRDALITWLHRKCESAGVSNTIVIVRPGDRFESSRHNAKQRGVEITKVGGWVVLRDNGKVYTKANVAVK